MTFEDFPTRIHPFDVYALMNELPDSVTVVDTKETIDLPIDAPEPYISTQGIITVNGRRFVQTTTVPVITEEGRQLI